MCPSLIEIGSKTAEKNSAQTNRQTDRHYENNGHLAVNQYVCCVILHFNYNAKSDTPVQWNGINNTAKWRVYIGSAVSAL